MYAKIAEKSDYYELETKLDYFGFEQIRAGVFKHSLMDVEFDFSACSNEGAMRIIFQYGYTKGFEDSKTNMRQALGL